MKEGVNFKDIPFLMGDIITNPGIQAADKAKRKIEEGYSRGLTMTSPTYRLAQRVQAEVEKKPAADSSAQLKTLLPQDDVKFMDDVSKKMENEPKFRVLRMKNRISTVKDTAKKVKHARIKF